MKHVLITTVMVTICAYSYAEPLTTIIDLISNGPGINYKMNLLLPKERLNDQEETCTSQAGEGSFTIYDYSVVIGMLVISLGIGVFYGFFDKKATSSASDFMLGTEMTIFPVTLSLTTSFITAIELLGNPSEIFFNGGQFSLIVISMVLVIPLALKVFYPIYDQMKLTSCYEYLGMRFGKEMRTFGGMLYIIQMCFYTSVSVLAPAIALSKATGLNTRLAIVLIYIVCVFYSSQGGLKAVVIADTFQACVLFVSLILILVIGTYLQEGGITEIFRTSNEKGRLDLLNFDPNPTTRHTVFSVVIGGFFYWASLLCVNQSTVQKAMSLRNLSKARIALTLSIVGLASVFMMNFYTGLMTFTKYSTCDPLKAGKISAIDQMIPFYVMETFGHFTSFVGIFVAGIFAASLGTVAACLSSLSAVTIEDILINGINIKITPEKSTRYAKWMNFGYGVASFCLIFLVEGRSVLQATLTLNGLIGGILLGLFFLGIFFKSANNKGAFFGGLLATLTVLTLGIFALINNVDEPFMETSTEGCNCYVNGTVTIEPPVNSSIDQAWYTSIYKVSYMWYSMIGTLLTIVFGLVISIATHYYEKREIEKISDFKKPIEKFTPNHELHTTLQLENRLKEVIFHSRSNRSHNEGGSQENIVSDENLRGPTDQNNDQSLFGVDNNAIDLDDESNRKYYIA